ncbi:phosphatidylinositol-bisphosphate-binding protein [Grosmannia clavigera kw1407]|uniref:Phosphatidylinositol-bisphosphate-binding protein n=1 Tax=Grosmannia clavigera (strain kw1407 / UAMH 11150) TaxID=655863 RepID=F0XK90_GROCL|nr:phosphatidylinositol-bisphosphate-binding protein [Grosmannia clavigera kw1407]EFX01942.1 phosphatidylinositol-bisphosphate-binding protein [Grosmannia clavigera kw1407]
MDVRSPIENSSSSVALSASFNLNCDCFVVATNNGFRVFDAATCKQLAKRVLKEGGVGMIQIFGRSNIIPLVVIWDEKKVEFTREIACSSRVRGIRVLDRKVVVLLQDEVRTYSIDGVPKLDARFPTTSNPAGLCSISGTHLAFPGRTAGQVQLVQNQTQAVSIIPAHASALGAIALSRDGSLLATASEKGTLVRVWSTANNARVAELRRGVDHVTIFSLGFNPSGTLLACTSDKGTLHVFDVPHAGGGVLDHLHGGPAQVEASDAGGAWSYEDSDVASYASDPRTDGGRGGDGSGRWGVLGKLPFMPRYFRDTVSFASAEFALDDGPGPNRQREAEEAATMRWTRLPRGTLGWTSDDTVAVLGAGIDAKYERFVVSVGNDGRRVCVRQAWANYMGID